MNKKPKITKQPTSGYFWCAHLLKALHELGGKATRPQAHQKTISFFDINKAVLDEIDENNRNILHHKIDWARSDLKITGYIGGQTQGVWDLTQKAKEKMPHILKWIADDEKAKLAGFPVKSEDKLQVAPLIKEVAEAFKEYGRQRREARRNMQSQKPTDSGEATHEEIGEENIRDDDTRDELSITQQLSIILQMKPLAFERLCKLFFRELNYEDVENTKATRDDGFDGVGYLTFGLAVRFKVLFEAKRYTSTKVNVNDVKVFESSVRHAGAQKGIFITTSNFTKDAKNFAEKNGNYVNKLVINREFFEDI